MVTAVTGPPGEPGLYLVRLSERQAIATPDQQGEFLPSTEFGGNTRFTNDELRQALRNGPGRWRCDPEPLARDVQVNLLRR